MDTPKKTRKENEKKLQASKKEKRKMEAQWVYVRQ